MTECSAFVRSRRHFLASACNTCKEQHPGERCGVCGMAFYCSKDHRRQDWQRHAPLCRAMHRACTAAGLARLYEKAVNMAPAEFRDLRHEVAAQCSRLLGRQLVPWEMELLYHPRVCATCCETDSAQLTPCQGCGLTYTCQSHALPADHDTWCHVLRGYSDVITYLHHHGGFRLPPLQALQSVLSASKLPASMSEVLDQCCDAAYNGSSQGEPVAVRRAVVSELATYPLTVLAALSPLLAAPRPDLTVHLVGAELQAEVQPLDKWEVFLLHCLPPATSVSLVFTGPELAMLPADGPGSPTLCAQCRADGKQLSHRLVCGRLYHEALAGGDLPPADLVCAFNSGMYRKTGLGSQDTWQQTIAQLLRPRSPPLLITEYTEHELQLDLLTIHSLGLQPRVISPPSRNPFASLRAGLNIISQQDSPVIFQNHSWALLQAQS